MGPHLRVVDPGFFTTVQDLGRLGLAEMGVPVGGAADALSLRLANLAVGNAPGEAGLEMTLIGAAVEFNADATIAIAGAACEAVIEVSGGGRQAVVACVPERVLRGEVLRVGPLRRGVRAYLCIAGGIEVQPVLGSRATHVAAGLGGFEGRALKREDRVPIGEVTRVRGVGLATETRNLLHETVERRVLRATDGAQAARFGEAAREAFWSGVFTVTPQCDRMGVRLSETRVDSPEGGRMTSEGMMWGAVQVPESGEPIVLMCDHPTTGGYPVIAAVAAVDLPVLGQLRPGDPVRFERVDQATALRLLRERERALDAGFAPVVASGRMMDLNCDLGESEDLAQIAVDSELLRIVTSANIACGGHAGDEAVGGSMERTVQECVARGVAIGAHPSYPDRANFGRVEMALTPEEIERVVGEQVRALGLVAARCGGRVAHVKPHGALYHAAMKREEIARAIGRAVLAIDVSFVMVGQAGGAGLEVWRAMGLRVAEEAFADRVYEADGSLRSRTMPEALIENPETAAAQAVRIAMGSGGNRGEYAPSRCETICVHGDTPGAVEVARAVRAGLEAAGVQVCAIARG